MTGTAGAEREAGSTSPKPGDVGQAVAWVFSDELECAYRYVDALSLELCLAVADQLALLSDEPASLDHVMERVGAVDESRYFVRAVLDLLTEASYAQRDDSGWTRCAHWPLSTSMDIHARARQACPAASATFDLIERCRAAAAGFVTGESRGLTAIFPRGDLTLWEQLHGEDRVMSIYADLAASALHDAVRPGMRVLEIGGGVGSVLSRCASSLEAAGIGEYWFTDVGHMFVDSARRRYANRPWLRFAELDIDRSFRLQGIMPGTFDLVVGVNVAHVARDLADSLGELRRVLAPGGRLILAEGSPPNTRDRWRLDIVFAFLRGWWDVAVDSLRPRPGFMLPSEWGRALNACGYDPVCLIPGEGWFGGPCRGGLILAGTSREPTECGAAMINDERR